MGYGGPEGLKRLVDACHAVGLAVILDVVYNHLGPEGNYLREYGPYFTDRYRTPWGDGINYDGPDSDAVRHFFISNALYWVSEYHIDGLRLDAVHGIYDLSASHILKDLSEAVHAEGDRLVREVVIIAESDQNDTRLIMSPSAGGYGLDAQWNDDFHHALHVAMTGERLGYYEDFVGMKDVATAFETGFVYTGQYSAFRRRNMGTYPATARRPNCWSSHRITIKSGTGRSAIEPSQHACAVREAQGRGRHRVVCASDPPSLYGGGIC